MPRKTVKLFYRDNQFVAVSMATLKPFYLWFFVHWICYIVTSFFCVDLFVEAILFYINAKLPFTIMNKGININIAEIGFLFLYCVSNFFFVYPCLQAAAITESRNELICKVNREYMKMEHISPEMKDKFVAYLKNQDYGFKLQIMCDPSRENVSKM